MQAAEERGEDVDVEVKVAEAGNEVTPATTPTGPIRPWTVPENLPPVPKPPHVKRAGLLAGDALYVARDGIVYCPLAKVACAEWRKSLRWMEGIENWEGGEIHRVPENGLTLLRTVGVRKATDIIYNPTILKFVVVREPAERLVSAFLEKCWGDKQLCCTRQGREDYHTCPYLRIFGDLLLSDKAAGLGIQLQRLPRAATAETDAAFVRLKAARGDVFMFRRWVRHTLQEVKERGCAVNVHWVPQRCRCGLDKLWPEYHIIPFHNMAAEAAQLAYKLERPRPERREEIAKFLQTRFEVPRDTPGKVTHAAAKVNVYYTQEALDMVFEAYMRDYQLFGKYWMQELGQSNSTGIAG